jgi:hypothetical protein
MELTIIINTILLLYILYLGSKPKTKPDKVKPNRFLTLNNGDILIDFNLVKHISLDTLKYEISFMVDQELIIKYNRNYELFHHDVRQIKNRLNNE